MMYLNQTQLQDNSPLNSPFSFHGMLLEDNLDVIYSVSKLSAKHKFYGLLPQDLTFTSLNKKHFVATWEAEIEQLWFQAIPGKKLSIPYLKIRPVLWNKLEISATWHIEVRGSQSQNGSSKSARPYQKYNKKQRVLGAWLKV
jgi:hypothetical protein